MQVRILGGEFKGQSIDVPNTRETRVVTSMLRKSLFDMCQGRVDGAQVLDLFAGSGALGFEALSRGAAFALFVDLKPMPIETLKKNITKLKVDTRAKVMQQDAFQLLPRLKCAPLDLLFVDPPYTIGLESYLNLLQLLDRHIEILAPGAWIFLEAPKQFAKALLDYPLVHLSLRKERRSGTTSLLIFEFLPAAT